MSGIIEDDEAPPDLVDVTAVSSDQLSSSAIDEEPTSRVPITLVTGISGGSIHISFPVADHIWRIPGSGQNDPVELHPH